MGLRTAKKIDTLKKRQKKATCSRQEQFERERMTSEETMNQKESDLSEEVKFAVQLLAGKLWCFAGLAFLATCANLGIHSVHFHSPRIIIQPPLVQTNLF